MDLERVKKEVEALSAAYEEVLFFQGVGEIVIGSFAFPNGWRPDTGSILYDLPSTYPQEPPTPYIDSCMQFRGKRPHAMLNKGPDGWCRYRFINLEQDWRPNFHTTITMAQMLEDSLKNPEVCDPWEEA